jgi:hypothetical protein
MPGPVTRDTSSLALGLAQVRVGASYANIATIAPVLTSNDSVGSMANTKLTVGREEWKHESGFPLLEDYSIPLRASAALECSFEEISPKNIAMALGADVSSGSYNVHSGAINLGALAAAAYLRMEAVYTFPNAINTMTIIFPRAQIGGSVEVDLQKEDAAGVPITFESKRADSSVTSGNAAWDDKPLGWIKFI